MTSRDHDSDGNPMEQDPDSDDGGCKDGAEDRNANGIHDRRSPANAEIWNFEFVDDSCQDLVGHLTYRFHSSTTIVPDVQFGETASTTSISVRLKPVPGEPGFYDSAEFRDECLGDLIEPGQRGYVPGHKTFNFNCHEKDWSASGIVTVP